MNPKIDLVVLTRHTGPLHSEVEGGIHAQEGVQIIVHRVVGTAEAEDRCRWEAIARARNDGKLRGNTRWLMFLDDDVVLDPRCISTLVGELIRRPLYAALAADYLGERCEGQIARHVAMGATLFRREALERIRFTCARRSASASAAVMTCDNVAGASIIAERPGPVIFLRMESESARLPAMRHAVHRWSVFLVACSRHLIGGISGCFVHVFWPPYERLATESWLCLWRSACIQVNADDSRINLA